MISFKNVSYKIKNKIILNNITFNIQRGEKVVIVGESGSGKSTIFNLLLRNVRLTSGKITYEKKDIYSFTLNQLQKYRQNEVIAISQKDDLFDNLTVLENLVLFYYYKDVVLLLKKANLLNLKDRYIYTLSGGERQRVAIIKACLASCNVLLCDEITSALDIENAIKIIDFVLLLFKNKTIIFITHDLQILESKINKIIKINDHKIIENNEISKSRTIKYKNDYKKKKTLIKVALLQSLKKLSLATFVIFVLSIISFYMTLSFDDIFIYFSKMSYENYLNYNVLFINDNKEIKVDINNNIYPSIDNQLYNCQLYINNKIIDDIYFYPYDKNDYTILVANSLLLEKYNIDKIEKLILKSDLINEQLYKVDVIKENNMFSKPCIYYNIKYFYKYYNYNIDNNLYIINYDFTLKDERFTNNPLYEKKKENLPYLSNNSYYDYLTFKMIFDAIKMIVEYFFSIVFMFSFTISILINISILIKDKKQIAIYISRGYSDLQILVFYLFPLSVYSLLILLVIITFDFLFIPYILSIISQLVSIYLSYYFIKTKSLNDLLKNEVLT